MKPRIVKDPGSDGIYDVFVGDEPIGVVMRSSEYVTRWDWYTADGVRRGDGSTRRDAVTALTSFVESPFRKAPEG